MLSSAFLDGFELSRIYIMYVAALQQTSVSIPRETSQPYSLHLARVFFFATPLLCSTSAGVSVVVFCCKYNNYLITLVQKQERFNIVLQIHSVILITLTLNQEKWKNIYIYNVSTIRGNFD